MSEKQPPPNPHPLRFGDKIVYACLAAAVVAKIIVEWLT